MNRLILLLCLVLLFLPSTFAADDGSLYAGFECKAKDDAIELVYRYVPEDERATFLRNKPAMLWDPWTLIVSTSKERIDALAPAKGQCRLRSGLHTVTISPEPGNMDRHGRCGGHMGASAIVEKDGKAVYAVQFESRECFDMNTPIVTRVVFKPGKAPETTTVASSRFRY